MNWSVFLRNSRAGDQLELFFVSAISSLLLVRFYLSITDYPLIGGETLHIAHMLWGGLLMLVSMVLLLSFIGSRVQRIAALVGGIGFGVFIDELGKFITRDNNYFYQPTIALIYAIFIILFLIFRYLSQRSKLTTKEYQINALSHLEDLVLDDFDEAEKKYVEELLKKAGQDDWFTLKMQEMIQGARLRPPKQPHLSFVRNGRSRLDQIYTQMISKRGTNRFVSLFFIVEALAFLASISYLLFGSVTELLMDRHLIPSGDMSVALLEAASAGVAALFALRGVMVLPQSRVRAYRLFQQATIIQIFLTTFFAFYREEFAALPGFLFHVVLLIALRAVLAAEERVNQQSALRVADHTEATAR